MTTQAKPQEGVGELRLRNGQVEVKTREVPGPFGDQWEPFDLSPDLAAAFDLFDFTDVRRASDGSIEFLQAPEKEGEEGDWFTTEDVLAEYSLWQSIGPEPEGWVGPWPPVDSKGNPTWSQIRSAREKEAKASAGPGQVVRGEDVGGQPGTFFIKQPSGNLTPYNPPQEEPFFETEARQAQQAAPQAARSMDALMAQELDRGNDARAMQIRRIEDAPSDFEVLKLAIQYADNPAALKVIYDFTKAQGLAAAQDPMFRQQQAAEPPTITWNAATGQWERIGQTAVGKLGEIDPADQAQALRQFDPTLFTGAPPGGNFPVEPGVTPMGTPEEALAPFQGTFDPESGAPIPPKAIPTLPGQKQPSQPAPGDVTFGTQFQGEQFTVPEAKKRAKSQALQDVITSQGINAPASLAQFTPAQQAIITGFTTQPGAGQTQLFNPETNATQILETAQLQDFLANPAGKGFQVTGSTPAPQFTPTKQAKQEDTFEDFQRQFEPFKTKRKTRSPFGRAFAVR